MARTLELVEAAAAFGARAAAMGLVLHGALDRVLYKIERTAAASIGEYQPSGGGFPSWAPLSPVTIARKEARGFAVPKPLLATGEMLASFGHEVNGLEGVAGAKDPKAVFHETGTSRMPPRPVWGPAAYNNRDAIRALIGEAVVGGITGRITDASPPAGEGGGWRYQIRV